MKNHIVTITFLLLAAISFALNFFIEEDLLIYCDIAAYALPTFAAIVEIILSEQTNKKLKEEIGKRAIWETLTQEEYDKLKKEGKLDEDTFYAPIEFC